MTDEVTGAPAGDAAVAPATPAPVPAPVPATPPPVDPKEAAKAARRARAAMELFLRHVYFVMALGLLASGAASFLATHIFALTRLVFGFPQFMLVGMAPVLLVRYGFTAHKILHMNINNLRLSFLGYSALMGLSLNCLFFFLPFGSLNQVFFVTAFAYAATSGSAYYTRRPLGTLESLLLMLAAGVCPAAVLSLATHGGWIPFVITSVGVAIFTAITAWETHILKEAFREAINVKDAHHRFAVAGALTLYLGFVNLFNSLLSLSFLPKPRR